MKLDDLFFWSEWSARRQATMFRLVVLCLAVLWLGLFLMFSLLREEAAKDVVRLEKRYYRVEPLVGELRVLEDRMGELAAMAPLAAAQQVSRDLRMEKQLASIRPVQLGGREGVQLLYEALDLASFLKLMSTFRDRSGLSVVSCVFTHRLDDPKRGDLQLVLSR